MNTLKTVKEKSKFIGQIYWAELCEYMSQGIAEIRHFRKSLGISGNA